MRHTYLVNAFARLVKQSRNGVAAWKIISLSWASSSPEEEFHTQRNKPLTGRPHLHNLHELLFPLLPGVEFWCSDWLIPALHILRKILAHGEGVATP
jgi:hypothetical protein